jgi:hypothetical protein
LTFLFCCRPTLEPDIALDFETIRWGDQKYYLIQNLAPSSHYEVRISYPAYVRISLVIVTYFRRNYLISLISIISFQYPTQFEIEIMPAGGASSGRDTLNVEKNMFQTDSKGHIIVRRDPFVINPDRS